MVRWFKCWTHIDKTWINLLFGWKETLSICHFYIDTWWIPRTWWTIWSSVVSPDWQILLGLGGQGATNMIPVLPVRYQVQILNYVTNVTMARTRIMLSLSWILLWNVSGWLWLLGRMTWSPSVLKSSSWSGFGKICNELYLFSKIYKVRKRTLCRTMSDDINMKWAPCTISSSEIVKQYPPLFVYF